MAKELFVPACYKYIQKKDGTQDTQRIFSVTKSAYLTKYPEQTLDDDRLFDFLYTNNILSSKIAREDIDTDHVELCFTIISQYNCNSTCQLCAYSPLYKNQFEMQESTLIGYAINNWQNLQNLIHSGVTCRCFRAVIPVSSKSTVPVVPLNRLAYEYLEKIPKSQTDMTSITTKIITMVKNNNKNKLSDEDLKIAQKYLDNLCNGNYQHWNTEKIAHILKDCFQLSYCEKNNTLPEKTSITTKDTSIQTVQPLAGLLTNKPAIAPSIRNTPQETLSKKLSPPNKVVNSQRQSKAATPSLSSTTNSQESDLSCNSFPPNEANFTALTHKNIKANYNQKASTNKKIITQTPLERKPFLWSMLPNTFQEYACINLDNADTLQMELFLEHLLMTPLLPVEMVSNVKEDWILLYAKEHLYCYSKNNLTILDTILPYISKSRFRKLICYEPYQLYSYFHNQGVYELHIFSIRLAMDFVIAEQYWHVTPDISLSQVQNFENISQAPNITTYIKNYPILYQKLSQRLEQLDSLIQNLYSEKRYIAKLLGYSYNKSTYCVSDLPLFASETLDTYVYTYTLDNTMVPPYLAIRFQISWKSETYFPIKKLLIQMVKNKVLERHDIGLLSFNNTEIIFAVSDNEYNYICSLTNDLANYFAEQENKIPVTIDECVLGGKK